MKFNDFFDKVYCINLDSRPDRWEEAKKEFVRNKIEVDRIQAINGKDLNLEFPEEIKEGAVGCSLSQLFCFKLSKYLQTKNFVLFEDDVEFDENFLSKFSKIYNEQVPDDWDMLYFGGQHIHGRNIKQVSENVYKCEYTLAAHSVAFKHTVYDKFIDKLVDITKPCDMHYAESHKSINAYVMIPHLTWQRKSFSDIEKQNVDYEFLKYHIYR